MKRDGIIVAALMITGALLLFYIILNKREAVVTTDKINSEKVEYTQEIRSGDLVEQIFTTSHDNLQSVSVAISYDESSAEKGQMLVEVVDEEGHSYMQQQIAVRYCPKDGFLSYTIPEQVKAGQKLILRISNISGDEDSAFSVLCTHVLYRDLRNVSEYRFNGEEQKGKILSEYTYIIGYRYHSAIAPSVWVIMIGFVVFEFIKKSKV